MVSQSSLPNRTTPTRHYHFELHSTTLDGTQALPKEAEQIIVEHELSALGFCEVFEIDDDLNKQRNVLSGILGHPNNTVQLAWAGRSDAHYIFCTAMFLNFLASQAT